MEEVYENIFYGNQLCICKNKTALPFGFYERQGLWLYRLRKVPAIG